mmetsp:Transcript_36036/g.36719  ORF Transcript_36036/g.36719 Transcript_36036/m.36719 type:complete len:305 (-) Transcript_36036:150-1064(-)
MARNEEKAASLFNKWTSFKKDFHADVTKRRPLLASECQSLPDAEKWRREIVREFTKKISAIQNATLGEHRIRELNDEINKLSRQKHYWETRIRELGGSDYSKGRNQFYDVEGKELPGAPHYKYYGAAKELPGVRELFAEAESGIEHTRQKRSRADLYKCITPDYYGYRDDDDGVLEPQEKEREKQLVSEAVSEFYEKRRRLQEDFARTGGVFGSTELREMEEEREGEIEGEERELVRVVDSFNLPGENTASTTVLSQSLLVEGDSRISALTDSSLKSLVFIPSQEEISAEVIERKKKALLEKYS